MSKMDASPWIWWLITHNRVVIRLHLLSWEEIHIFWEHAKNSICTSHSCALASSVSILSRISLWAVDHCSLPNLVSPWSPTDRSWRVCNVPRGSWRLSRYPRRLWLWRLQNPSVAIWGTALSKWPHQYRLRFYTCAVITVLTLSAIGY